MMSRARTLLDKIWEAHAIVREDDETLLYVDRCLHHEGSNHSYAALSERRRRVASPRQIFAFADHYVPTEPTVRASGVGAIGDGEIRHMIELFEANTSRHGVTTFGLGDGRQGILHVSGPELGLSLPGIVLVGGDSHSSTHGAFGNLSFGIGSTELTHVLATQTIWQQRPRNMRISVQGRLGDGVTPKDIILAIIAKIGVGGGAGHVIEYAGSCIRALSMDERMTICNMSIEAGAKAGMIAPDETTFDYLARCPLAPPASAWDKALAYWRGLPSDGEACFDSEIEFDAASIAPMVSWGFNPEQTVAVDGCVPDPQTEQDASRRADIERALDYMGLRPGMPITAIRPDRVFIGSCTNSRIDDLRAAARIAARGKAVIPTWVVPGSQAVKRQAEAEGLDRIFQQAGFEWREPGCSLCTALNGDQLKPGERCASTSNRNFQGRQGPGGRTHLMSPAMAAAAAIAGHLVDVRRLPS
jgi:3-isopropylmalate/(R)-2-methylmalate dehydratase large subunit